jgi:prepilin-type N-terminal cleavage/methylation domain-containing protein
MTPETEEYISALLSDYRPKRHSLILMPNLELSCMTQNQLQKLDTVCLDNFMKNKCLKKQNNAGMTLMEVLIVLAVLSILAGIVIPAWTSRLPEYRLRAASRDLCSNLQRAKQEAILQNTECAVYFDTANNSYQIVGGGPDALCDGSPEGTPPVPKNDDILLNYVTLSNYGSGVRFGGGIAKKTVPGGVIQSNTQVSYVHDRVRFDPGGMAREMGYVYLTNTEKSAFAVGTPSMAGAIVQKRWLGQAWQ